MDKPKNKDQEVAQLKSHIKQLQFVIDQTPNYLFWKDVNSIFMGCNRLFAESAGLASPRDIEGKSDYELPWSLEESERYIADDRAIIGAKTPKLNIEESQTINGVKVTLLTSKVPMIEDGEVKGIIGIYSDITALKEAQQALSEQKEAAEKASAVKSNFLAMVSHELRTPLNGILGIVQVMERRCKDKELMCFIDDIKGAATSLANLVDDILDISSIEKGALVIRNGVFELGEVTDRSIADMRHVAEEKGLALTFKSNLKSSSRFFGDGMRLRQVLSNLLNNAIKFTDHGHISVVVDLQRKVDTQYLVFTVEDTGIGIAEHQTELIFESFRQLHDKYDRIYQGVGLGLSICRELVTAMHGQISVESKLGEGSVFRFSVPIKLDESQTDLPILSNRELIEKIHGSILVIEDNILNRRVLEMMLEEFAVQVTMATNGAEALDYLKSQHFDLIFLDISLPDMDGFEITRQIRKTKSKFELPIIAVTAHAFDSDKLACLESGMNDILIKPVSIHKLTEKMVQWLLPSR